MRALVSKTACAALATIGLCSVGSVAHADDPKFAYDKYEAKKTVEYVATASAGLLLTTGNANQFSMNAALMLMRNDGKNKLQLDANGAYARAASLVANDANGNGTIDGQNEIHRTTTTSTALWNTKLRYDRFFTENNMGYVRGFAWGPEPAGKKIVGGGQIGYARQLYKSDIHLVQVEAGYDFSAVKLVDPTEPVFKLHSLRLFAGYTLTASKDTILQFSVEYLGNMNPYNGPYPDGSGGKKRIGAFGDSRVYGIASLTTRIWKKLAFRFSFTARYDNVPAPLPAISGFPYAAGFVPPAEKLDTITDASLVVTFL
jgi:hypothetical protein